MINEMLQFKTTTYFLMDHDKLENIVKEELGLEFDFVQREECSNDSEHKFNVTGKSFEDYPMSKEVFIREPYLPSDEILNFLAYLGRIPTGNYLISVCW